MHHHEITGLGQDGPVLPSARSVPGPQGQFSIPATVTPMSPVSRTSLPVTTTPRAKPPPAKVAGKPGVPVSINVDGHVSSARVESHGLAKNGVLYIPHDPRVASWNNYLTTAPGASHGTAVITSHINYNGVNGAFYDLPSYAVGTHLTLKLKDGRILHYHGVAASCMGFDTPGAVVSKSKATLDADAKIPGTPLHHQLYDQTDSFSCSGGPKSGRLLIVTCGGPFDRSTGNYLDNYFFYALPDA